MSNDPALSATPAPDVDGLLRARLEEVLQHVDATRDAGAPPGPAVRGGLHAVCADAHRFGVGPARLLVLLKGAWRAPRTHAEPAAWLRAEAALERVVAVCIQEYYRPVD